MRIFIPSAVQEALEAATDEIAVLGTLNRDCNVATVTGARPIGDADGCEARQILAVLDQDPPDTPLRVTRNGGLAWSLASGEPVDVDVFESSEFFKRTPFDPRIMNHLQKEKLLIVGVGSVGAPMGLELARSGVGSMVVVDKDVLEIHNCMRHVLGPAYVGWPKPVAFSHFIEEQVPTCDCVPVFDDLFVGDRAGLRRVIDETRPTRILAATDSLRIQYLCQRLALHYDLPMMAVWCDNNAVEGEVFMWEPGQASGWRAGRPERGCYACMRDPEEITITRSSSFDYSSDDPDSYGGEPALGTFINRINNIASILMMAWMLRDCPVETKLAGSLAGFYESKGLQYVRLGGPYAFEADCQITAKAPWAVEWYRVLKREACSFCNDSDDNARVLFPESLGLVDNADDWASMHGV